MQTQAAFSIKNYTDREGMESHAHHSALFIHFSASSISMVVAAKSQDKVLGLRVLEVKQGDLFRKSTAEIREMLEALEFDKQEYSSTKLVIENNAHALVPEALFSGEKAASFLKLNTPAGDRHHVFFNRIQKNMVSVFAIPATFYQSLKSLFPQADMIHETEILLSVVHTAHQKENKDHLYVHIHDTYMEIVHLKNNDLHYLNTFPFEADTDVIYYILSVAELLKLNQDKLHVDLFGQVSNTGSLPGLMKKYIVHVDWIKRPELYAYPASFREFADHRHYLQTCSLLCAS